MRFWGTRGSLSAPLDATAVRAKIRQALLAACERGLADAEAIDAFIDRELPFSVRGTFGGNTSCVEIGGGSDDYLLCDLGTGVREFGNHVIAEHGPARPHCFNVFLSHVHWDHIMGFPFFAPAYIAGNRIRIHGCHKTLREAMVRQQSAPCFPGQFGSLPARDRVHRAGARRRIPGRRLFGQRDQAVARGRFLRLPVLPRRQVDRLFDRLRAQGSVLDENYPSSSSSGTPTW